MLKKDNVEMRGSKDEERWTSPMFPRLNVRDTEKPGQKAPPRNKMALNQQLTIPSQKFGSGNSESSLMSSMSSSHLISSPTQPLSSSAKCSSVKSHDSKFKHFEDDTRAMRSAQYNKDRENQPYYNLSFSMQCKDISEKRKDEIGVTNLQERRSMSNQTEESRKISNTRQNHAERSFSFLSNRTSADASREVLSTESLKVAHPFFNQANGTCGTDTLKRLHCANDRSNQDTVAVEKIEDNQDKPLLEYVGGIGKNDTCKVTNESVSKSSPKVEKRSHNHEGQKHVFLQDVDLQRRVLTPGDAVKVLGEKQFWKARKAMVDQQRTFRLQVFELHRLLKVQKLIAPSPDLLLEDNIYSRKTLPKSSKVQKPCPSVRIETNRELTQQANTESHSRSSPWWVAPPRNQWLVPVISPSKGLVYKPYTAPCHPDTGYMSPVCGPPSLTSARGDFLNAAYGVPASHQQGITGFVMPIMTSGSAVDQGSCNMWSQISQTVKCSVEKFQALKEPEIQGSSESSLPPRPKQCTLPLFPTEPTSRSTDQNTQTNEKLTHVIKVVPRNRKIATESAAQIFRSITEERKQCC